MNQKATFLLITGLAVIVSLAASEAKAYTEYRDVQWIVKKLDPGESYTGTFDIVEPYPPDEGPTCIVLWGCDQGGYVLGTPLIDTRAAFLIFDVGGVEAEIVLGSDSGRATEQVEISEFVFFFHVENIDADMLVEGLMADGKLQYKVTNLADSWLSESGGDADHYPDDRCDEKHTFWLKAAKLEAAIPEPSAALVFAAGFGIMGTRMRRRRRT